MTNDKEPNNPVWRELEMQMRELQQRAKHIESLLTGLDNRGGRLYL